MNHWHTAFKVAKDLREAAAGSPTPPHRELMLDAAAMLDVMGDPEKRAKCELLALIHGATP